MLDILSIKRGLSLPQTNARTDLCPFFSPLHTLIAIIDNNPPLLPTPEENSPLSFLIIEQEKRSKYLL